MILLDTDTLTHFSYGNANVQRRIEAAGEEELAVAVITRNEILRGRADSLLKADDEEELRKAMERFRQTEAMLADFLVVASMTMRSVTSGSCASRRTSRRWAGPTCSLRALRWPTMHC